jgi:hypothetical protein
MEPVVKMLDKSGSWWKMVLRKYGPSYIEALKEEEEKRA